jgi:hypothetical protein
VLELAEVVLKPDSALDGETMAARRWKRRLVAFVGALVHGFRARLGLEPALDFARLDPALARLLGRHHPGLGDRREQNVARAPRSASAFHATPRPASP